jgi:hypothetical protein
MIDCSKEISKFCSKEVCLNESQRKQMRVHRDANRAKLRAGLAKDEREPPKYHITQGSYAMHTMVQHPKNDYDIDDGAVFTRDQLRGPKGGDMSPRGARDMVCRAVSDDRLNTPPEVLKNCVRVYYNEKYHVDIPVYREYEDDEGNMVLEFASSVWGKSDPRELTRWYNGSVIENSPDTTNGRQMRRVTCLSKAFSRSRGKWKMPSGLIQSVLIDEKYQPTDARDDEALFDTMQAIYSRLVLQGRQVHNPTDSEEELTKGSDDPKMVEFEDRLEWAIGKLRPVKDETCTYTEAIKLWKEVFGGHAFFDQFIKEEEEKKKEAATKAAASVAAASVAASAPRNWGC